MGDFQALASVGHSGVLWAGKFTGTRDGRWVALPAVGLWGISVYLDLSL